MVHQYTYEEIAQWQEDHSTALWVDVRELDEWRMGHVPNAVLYPLSSFEYRMAELHMEVGEQPVVFYCAHGVRSSMAATMYHASYPHTMVINVLGGYAAMME